jgi:hypothetical protein
VLDVVFIEKPQEAGNAVMLLDAKQISRSANTERSEFGKRISRAKLDVELGEATQDFGIANAHGAWGAPFQVKP